MLTRRVGYFFGFKCALVFALHKKWGINFECVKHFMALLPADAGAADARAADARATELAPTGVGVAKIELAALGSRVGLAGAGWHNACCPQKLWLASGGGINNISPKLP